MKRFCPACDSPQIFEDKVCTKCNFNYEERE